MFVERKSAFLIPLAILMVGPALARHTSITVADIASQNGIAISPAPHLAGTALLTLPTNHPPPPQTTSPKEGSIFAVQLEQEHAYWLEQIAQTPKLRDQLWHPDFSNVDAYQESIKIHRNHLWRMLGLLGIDAHKLRLRNIIKLSNNPIRIERVSLVWDTDFPLDALLFIPPGKPSGAVISIPSAEESPAEFTGLVGDKTKGAWVNQLLARHLIICVPITVERKTDFALGARYHLDRREILYRLGFIVGRTLVGLEVQQATGLASYVASRFSLRPQQLGLLGERQGGMTALYAAAASPAFAGAVVIDYFQQREKCWQEPVDRMLYGQLNEFGDAEVAALIAPKPLRLLYTSRIPAVSVQAEIVRAKRFYSGLGMLARLSAQQERDQDVLLRASENVAELIGARAVESVAPITTHVSMPDIEQARNEHFQDLLDYLRKLDNESDAIRKAHLQLLSIKPNERATRSLELKRELSRLMGIIPLSDEPLNVRTRLIKLTDKFSAYDVLLEAVPGVEAYGQLLVPRQIQGKVPVIICQHGLGGRPADITGIGPQPEPFYHALGSHLADLGYVVFAPYLTVPVKQELLVNPLVRQAASLGKMRTSLELAKLHRIIDFLQSLPFVDNRHIGYYGLSYGGYSAIWMPPLEPRIAATVISGHFNDWRKKLTDETNPTSYLLHPDADFFNWNVLNRFSHIELIAAMWPRAVCIEFGDHDTTTTSEWHSQAWKELMSYADAWGLTGLEAKVVRVHYDGIHEIHGNGTIDFLNRWLRPEMDAYRDHSYNLLPPNVELHVTGGALEYGQGSAIPLATHNLDSSENTVVDGRFYVPRNRPIFTGLKLKLSRTGHPGGLIVRFGTSKGANDIGEARFMANQIDPLFDLWYEARIKPVRLDPSKLYYFSLRTASGRAPRDYYVVYGPQPLGGKDIDPCFGLSYRVLTAAESREPKAQERFEFMRSMMAPYRTGSPVVIVPNPPRPNEVTIDGNWSIHTAAKSDEVIQAAAEDLDRFLHTNLHVRRATGVRASSQIDLSVMPAGAQGVNTAEGYRISIAAKHIDIQGSTSRGVMRGVYELEDRLRYRQAPFIAKGIIVHNCRFSRRITTAVHPGEEMYHELSQALPYTDGLLQRISHSGFNAIWVWVNSEEVTLDSEVFPELNDPNARERLDRLANLTVRARRYGIDVYAYFANGYNHHLSESFFERHPDVRGYGWGPPLCTSVASVRNYYAETVATMFHHVPLLRGLIVIYDSEGFWYCGNSARTLKQCPRCSRRTQQEVAAELLSTLDNAVHHAGGNDKELIAWNYNIASQWVLKLFPLLPKNVIIQADFDKGMLVERNGIRHQTEDYNISNVGPPALFVKEYEAARAQGLTVMAKTEHAVSQEFVFVPYIPCMEQWYRRIAAMRQFDLGGWFGNWNHYGYTPSRPAQLINRMSFDPAPSMEDLLRYQAERDFGSQAAPHVLRAWHDFSEAIRAYPYSDTIARVPGPIQKGPSQPLFLDPAIKGFGPWRSWQNDLKWTAPWGPRIATKYLGQVENWFREGDNELAAAGRITAEQYRPEIESEWRIGRTLQSSVHSVLDLIEWLQTRNDFYQMADDTNRRQLCIRLQNIALDERRNALELLPLLSQDSRLGYASVGNGGLFSSALVEWKIGYIDDVLIRQFPIVLENRHAELQ